MLVYFVHPVTLALGGVDAVEGYQAPGGSLLLVPMACPLFEISMDNAMKMVGVGFIVSVIQNSMETALNSSGDVIFTATAEYREWKKQGRNLPI